MHADKKLNKLDWKIDQLWKGCILKSIAHAIMVAHDPFISYEHSWIGVNYCIFDGAETDGVVTFYHDFCVAAFRKISCDRFYSNSGGFKCLKEYYNYVPQEIIRLSEKETLPCLLVNDEELSVPSMTTAFWGKNNELFTADSLDEFLAYGGESLIIEAMDFDSAICEILELYEMEPKQVQLLLQIYTRKVNKPHSMIVLSKKEIDMIGSDDQDGLKESYISFNEMNIDWEQKP